MDYDEQVVEFLSQKENLRLALEVVEHIEDVKRKLRGGFWESLKTLLVAGLAKLAGGELWEVCSPDERESECMLWIPSKGIASDALVFGVGIGESNHGGQTQLFYGIRSSKDVSGTPGALKTIKGLQEELDKKKCEFGAAWWPAWKWIDDLYPGDKWFLVRLAENRDALITDVANLVLGLFEESSGALAKANGVVA